jgi:signal transduction histidine kinase
MRRTLALVSVAVTSMVALAFLIPLALVVRELARDRALADAERQASALTPVLAITTDAPDVERAVASTGAAWRLAVRLPDGGVVGRPRVPEGELRRAAVAGASFTAETADGYAVVQPVALPEGRVAVVEVFTPSEQMTQGVTTAWKTMAGIAVGLVVGSVFVADRLGSRVVGSARSLAAAARALGQGDLDVRVEPAGPTELAEAGAAFNAMADRVVKLLTAERELIADLSHRLRTPLTALSLDAGTLGDGAGARRVRSAVTALEQELDAIIVAARKPLVFSMPTTCDVTEVIRDRVEFWSALAEDQGRPWRVLGATEPVIVALSRGELAAVVDALLGNVFRHTAEGTAFAVWVRRSGERVILAVDDAGPGVADPEAALRRGASGAGSTGLGLDIARRAAASTGGELRISRSRLGGASIQLLLHVAETGAAGRRGRRGARGTGRLFRRWRGPHGGRGAAPRSPGPRADAR